LAFGIVAPSNPLWRGHKAAITRTFVQEAAALWESLSQNHPFVDGNKRVAVTVTAAFLKVNGYLLEFDDLEAFSFLIGRYESGTMQFVELEKWLRVHVKRSSPRN
jgi:death on curing protein